MILYYAKKLDIEPHAKGRPRIARGGFCYTPPATKNWERRAREIFKSSMPSEVTKDALYVNVVFHVERPKSVKREFVTTRPDIDNYIKSVLDAANGVLWNDDSQIVELLSKKVYGAPAIYIQVYKLEKATDTDGQLREPFFCDFGC